MKCSRAMRHRHRIRHRRSAASGLNDTIATIWTCHRVVARRDPGSPRSSSGSSSRSSACPPGARRAWWYELTVAAERPGSCRPRRRVRVARRARARGARARRHGDRARLAWHGDPSNELVAALRAAHARGARLVSICTGAFLLAAPGCSTGEAPPRTGATPSCCARRYPRVKVNADVLYVDDGDLLTSAGSAAGIDLCLHLVRRDHGADVANASRGGSSSRPTATAARRSSSTCRARAARATTRSPRRWPGRSAASTSAWPGRHGQRAPTCRRVSFIRRFRGATGTSPAALAARPATGCARCRCSNRRTSRWSRSGREWASPPPRPSGATSRAPTAFRLPGGAAPSRRGRFVALAMKKLLALIPVLVLLVPASAAAAPATRSATPARRRTASASARRDARRSASPSWDGVPLDVDVTLPPTGDGPFPTIVMLHGWGGSKTDFESADAGTARRRNQRFHYNNNFFAQRGYAVVNLSARGFGSSLRRAGLAHVPGLRPGLAPPGRPALRGPRHPVPARPARRPGRRQAGRARRDRHLLRRRPVHRARLPARTASACPTARFVPWTSPKGTPLSIAAAYPRWPGRT